MEKPGRASISHISSLPLEIGNPPLPQRAFSARAALPAHPAELPGPEAEPAPHKPCPRPSLHPLPRPPLSPAHQSSRTGTAPNMTHFCIQSSRCCWKAHNAAVIPGDQRLPHPPTGTAKTSRSPARGCRSGALGRERPSASPLRAPGSAGAESRKWDTSLGSPGLCLGLAGKLSRMTGLCQMRATPPPLGRKDCERRRRPAVGLWGEAAQGSSGGRRCPVLSQFFLVVTPRFRSALDKSVF